MDLDEDLLVGPLAAWEAVEPTLHTGPETEGGLRWAASRADLRVFVEASVALATAITLAGCRSSSDDCFHRLDAAACQERCRLRDTTMGAGTACLIWGNYDKPHEHEAFQEGCTQGNSGACGRLAAIESDPARKKVALAAACADPLYPEACTKLAEIEADTGARRAALEAGCRGGDDRACERFAPLEPDRDRRRAVFEENCRRRYVGPCPRVQALRER